MKKILLPLFLTGLFLFGLNGCGADYRFARAKKLEKQGSYAKAIENYLAVADKFPAHKLAPESLYAAAIIYSKKLNNPPKANDLFCEIIKLYSGQAEWVDLAKNGIFNLYNYFPLSEGNIWTEGDSQSMGKNMKMTATCYFVDKNIFKITKKYYAGKNLVENLKSTRYYRKQNLELQESQTSDFKEHSVLLKYPFEKGTSWVTSQDNRKLRITYVAIGIKANVKSGYFERCIKVKEEDVNLAKACKYKYYAENTGQILTTVGSDKKEYNVTELLLYKLAGPDLQQ